MNESNATVRTPRVSVVILNWNGCKLLERFLPSVQACCPTDIAEIIVVDNGSTDDSLTILRNRFSSVRRIEFDQNHGFAEGYNKALEEVKTEYTVLLNSDVEVTSGWLDIPLAVLDNDPSIACVQPKIRSKRKKSMFEYAGACGGYLDRYGYPFCRGRVMHVIEKDTGQYDTTVDLLWASGACLFVRTDVYKKEGGLDATFFAHQEEVDMCWRLRNRGYRIVCTPQSVVYHVGAATLKKESPRKTFLNFRNNLLMLYKNLPEKELASVMRLRTWLDHIAAIKFLVSGNPSNARAVYKARKDFHSLLPQYKSIREENLRKTVTPNPPEILQKSLLLLFYLKGKKRFSEIDFNVPR